jgi:hypothetical protein
MEEKTAKEQNFWSFKWVYQVKMLSPKVFVVSVSGRIMARMKSGCLGGAMPSLSYTFAMDKSHAPTKISSIGPCKMQVSSNPQRLQSAFQNFGTSKPNVGPNSILDDEILVQRKQRLLPDLPKRFFVVGSETLSDQETVQQLFGVICGEYAIGSEPDIC